MEERESNVQRTAWLACTLAIALTGCSGLGSIPRQPGFYALEDGDRRRLDGKPEWERKTWTERSNLSPEVSFLIRDRRLAAATDDPAQLIQLHRVGWIRSEITAAGEIRPVTGSQWANAQIEELRVPVRLHRDGDHQDVVRVTPLSALAPGLYTLSAHLPSTPVNARFGVRWPAVNQHEYAAAHCVDRYPSSPAKKYKVCTDQDLSFASALLKVHLVKPEIRDLPGAGRELVVKGVVLNTAERSLLVPPLRAQLRNREGAVVERWQFVADTKSLSPGASVSFESRFSNPPVGAADVQVTLGSPTQSPGPANGQSK